MEAESFQSPPPLGAVSAAINTREFAQGKNTLCSFSLFSRYGCAEP